MRKFIQVDDNTLRNKTMTKSKPLADFIKIDDELRDDFEDFKTVYLDAQKHNGNVELVKFSYALAKFDFDLDCLNSIIDFLQADNGKLK